MAEVLIRAPDGEQRVPLKSGTLSVGRERFNDVVVNDPKASRKHAQIEKIGEQWIITDLGSSNGTFLRGERISQVIIHEMDIISIGAVQLVFTGVEEKVADDLMPTTMASAEVLQAKMDAMAQARTAQAAAPIPAPSAAPGPAAAAPVPEPAAAAAPPPSKPAAESAKKITDAMDEEVAEQGTVAIMADQAAVAKSAPPPPTITPGLSNPFSSAAPKGAGTGGSMSNEAPPAAAPAAPAPAAPAVPIPAGGLPIEPMNLAVMRLVALIIDSVIFFPLFFIQMILGFIPILGLIIGLIMMFVWPVIIFCYHGYFLSKFGATYGKRWMGLRVVQDPPGSGNPSFGSVIIRILVHFFTCGIGPLLAAFDKEGKGLHDKVAKTRVLKVKEPGFDGFGMKQA